MRRNRRWLRSLTALLWIVPGWSAGARAQGLVEIPQITDFKRMIQALPDAVFNREPVQGRRALANKLDAVNRMIVTGESA